jgi:hypothetical protein
MKKDLIEKQEELNQLVIKTIRAWHGMDHVQKEDEEMMWGIYNRNSPEMKRINELMSEIKSELASLKQESQEKEFMRDEYHVWVIPDRREIYVEDRGCGIPVGASEHIVLDNWDGALKLGRFLAKFCNYDIELDNEAGRWADAESIINPT